MIYVQVLLENVYNVHIHMNNMTYFFNRILSSVNPSIYSLTLSARNFIPCRGHTSKPEGSARWSCRSVWLQRRGGRSCVLLPRRASQFNPAIDKERKLISNLGRNMPVLPDSPECAALRADMKGDPLNSRFQHKNKLVKSRGVV